jgi:molybdopterin synthase sulfur carrier subunit
MKRITVLTFGVLTELTGSSSFVVTDVNSTDELIRQLHTQFPKLKELQFAIAVNKEVVHQPAPLDDNTTVALLPPFSGG